MKKIYLSISLLGLFLAGLLWFFTQKPQDAEKSREIYSGKYEPSDHFFLQRAYPYDRFDIKSYTRSLHEARERAMEKNDFPGFDAEWTVAGPGNLGARINTIAVHPENPDVIYVGFSAGGVFKTVDGGQNWEPVFDDQPFLAIGHIALDPSDPEVVYVGTGDPNISGYPFIGDGLYRSEDGGATWTHLGLTEQRIISKVIIDPNDPDRIFVGCMGIPFERNNDRGLYRSEDGGQTWEQVLFISDQAGVIDMVMDHQNPLVIYAAGWDRIRNNSESIVDGPGGKIYKTTNGGDTWNVLQGGLPDFPIGRIGLAMSATDPDLLYALYVGIDLQVHNIFKTINGGVSWEPIIDFSAPNSLSAFALGGFGWYFGKIRVSPYDNNDIFVLGVELWRSRDGGQTWNTAAPPWWQYAVHADKHDLIFTAPGNILLATDGGLYGTTDDALNWQDIEDIPATQFYRVAYNPHQPDWYYGGAQDNGTTGGPELGFQWPRIYGGDGFQAVFHPLNANVFYVESQNGSINVTTNGGSSFSSATQGIVSDDRRNWDAPYIMSAHNPSVLYTGTYRIYRSSIGAVPAWQPISGDLTDGIVIHPRFHNISTISESPLAAQLLYVGTSDGNVWRTDNDGTDWLSLSGSLPDRYVTSIKASPDFQDWVYVSHSGYKDNEFIPRIFRSGDRGMNWESISGDLPDLAINEIFVLPGRQDTVIFVATDGGVYGTVNAGQNWARLGSNMPMVAVYDLGWNMARNELIAGTHARSIMTFPIDSIRPLEVPEDTTVVSAFQQILSAPEVKLFPSPARDYIFVEFSNNEPGRGYQLVVIDQNGRPVLQQKGEGSGRVVNRLNVASLPAGIYHVKIKIRHQVLSGRFLKAKGR
jgi:photosystem II stability/assembly factor-like uncharacterized protein